VPPRRQLAAALPLVAALLVCAAPAGAEPQLHGYAREIARVSGPPDTEECRFEFDAACYSPQQVQRAYDATPLYSEGITGAGTTIAIVDSFGSPTIERDLAHYDRAFGLPAPHSLRIIQPAGRVPRFDPANGEMVAWAGETTQDVEAAHTIAPGASILLVETPVSETVGVHGFPQIVAAENYVLEHHLAQVISQSFSSAEPDFPSVRSIMRLRSAYFRAAADHVSVLDAAGDHGVSAETLHNRVDAARPEPDEYFRRHVASWPASDPLVTAVGGTNLRLDAAGLRTTPERVWSEFPTAPGPSWSGSGGPSAVFARPSFQRLIPTGAPLHRATPDISMSAAGNNLLAYSSFRVRALGEHGGPAWWIAGGTSESTPLFAGFVALADQLAGHPLGDLNPRLYALAAADGWGADGLVDVTRGNNTFHFTGVGAAASFTVPGYAARAGYDMASGLGTVDAYLLAHSLAG
jgi:subtilase family serine protease